MAPQKRKNANNRKDEVSKEEKEITMETTAKKFSSDTRYLWNFSTINFKKLHFIKMILFFFFKYNVNYYYIILLKNLFYFFKVLLWSWIKSISL